MSVLQGATNITIQGGTFTAVSNTTGYSSASNDIVAVLLSHCATAGLLDAKERFDAPKCDKGTRTSMICEMKKFVQGGGAASLPALYWLHGPAGVGKSALAQSLALALKAEGNHAASFFFSRTAQGRNDGNQLVVTLACQLALSIPALKPLMAKVVQENPLILEATNAVKMQGLIVDPINELSRMSSWSPWSWLQRLLGYNPHPRLILVDGLDECSEPKIQQDLILCIADAVRQLALPFRFILSCRPESHILATIKLDPACKFTKEDQFVEKNLGDDEDADEQITTFLLKEFAEIRRTHPIRAFLPQQWPLPMQIAQLVSKSSKGFIYPATVIRYIRMPNSRPDDCLERILGSSDIPIHDKPYEPLDALYRCIFASVPEANKEAVRNIFHFLVVPHNLEGLLPPRLIERYFKYKPGHVQHVLGDLLCLVSFTEDSIKVLHASLPDFLLDRARSGPLYIDVSDARAAITACFRLALSTMTPFHLPDFRFAGFFEHVMYPNESTAVILCDLVNVDLKSRYMRLLSSVRLSQDSMCAEDLPLRCIEKGDVQGILFVAAYLMVLVIKNAEQRDIREHIAGIISHISARYRFVAALQTVREAIFPTAIPFFIEWISSSPNAHRHVDPIFAAHMPPSQREIRQEIFWLCFLMMAPLFGRTTAGEPKYALSQNYNNKQQQYGAPTTQPQTIHDQKCWNYISYMLLDFLIRRPSPAIAHLKALAVCMLEASLAQTGYSVSLIALLNDLLVRRAQDSDMRNVLRKLAPVVVGCVERISLEAPSVSQWEAVGLADAWKEYFDQRSL